ncbi:MAG: hypothetical protein R1F54_04650 [Candidatus Zeuxoniibacter abyssi]|nr:MAG: hypothetical protein R1F54_04650 [Candidatus Persebacteraceae bacterium AB1(2)]
MNNLLVIALFLLTATLLSACGEQLSGLDLSGLSVGKADQEIKQFDGDGGDVELRLDPVDVWDDIKTEPVKVEIDGRELYVRKRPGGTFEHAWVRMGLFWHSKTDYVYVPIVVLGPPVEIRELRVDAGPSFALLKKAENFHFEPGSRIFDGKKEKSSAVFIMSINMLSLIASSKTARLSVKTNRGNLNVGLGVVVGNSINNLRGNAKNLIAQFKDMVEDVIKEQGAG